MLMRMFIQADTPHHENEGFMTNPSREYTRRRDTFIKGVGEPMYHDDGRGFPIEID